MTGQISRKQNQSGNCWINREILLRRIAIIARTFWGQQAFDGNDLWVWIETALDGTLDQRTWLDKELTEIEIND